MRPTQREAHSPIRDCDRLVRDVVVHLQAIDLTWLLYTVVAFTGIRQPIVR